MNKLKLFSNERVDRDDLDHISTGVVEEFQRLLTDLVTGAATRVMRGFDFAILTATTASLDLGAAIAASSDGLTVATGQLFSEGETTKTLDFSALGADTYGVWVRFQFKSGQAANRIFWDPVAGEETASSVETRDLAEWSVSIATQSPGPEWWEAWEVVWDGADLATSPINDKRVFLFEGDADAGYGSDWGGGNDRNADRATYGVTTLERFMAATRKKLEELTGAGKDWWEASTHGVDDAVAKAGDTMSGDLLPDADGTLDLGATNFRWAGKFKDVVIERITNLGTTALAEITSRINLLLPASTTGKEYVHVLFAAHQGGGGTHLYVKSDDGAMVFTQNAEWANDGGTYKWTAGDTGLGSAKLELHPGGFKVSRRDAGAGFWTDSAWGKDTVNADFTVPEVLLNDLLRVLTLQVATSVTISSGADLDVQGTMNADKGITELGSALRSTTALAAVNPGIQHRAATNVGHYTLLSETLVGTVPDYWHRIYISYNGFIFETVNAFWNESLSLWERDSVADAFLRQFDSDVSGLFTHDSGGASQWATWDTVRSVEFKPGLGQLTLIDSVSGYVKMTPSLLELVTSTTALRIASGNATKTAAVDNKMYANSIVKGYAYITFDGSSVPTVVDGQNLTASQGTAGFQVDIGFISNMVNANYAVIGNIEVAGGTLTVGGMGVTARATTGFTLIPEGGGAMANSEMSVYVFGSQPQP